MRLARNLFAWVLVGVFTVFLAVGVEMVSHKSFSHGATTTSALSATASTVATSSAPSATSGSTALVSTTPVTITRTYEGDDSYSPSATVTGSGTVSTTSVTYHDN